MRRTSIFIASMVCAVGAWVALAMPAASQILTIARHAPETAQTPAPAHGLRQGFANGSSIGADLRQRFGLGSSSPTLDAGNPPVARYMVRNTIGFTLDTSGPLPLLRYSNSTEVWALRPQAAPRGDTLYVNDAGEPMLRATRLGGLTAFMPDQPQGMAAAFVGSAQPIIALPDVDSGVQLAQRMRQQSGHLSRIAGHTIGFDASDQDIGPEGLPLIADTFNVAMDAFSRALSPQNAKKKSLITDLDAVRIREGVPPDAFVQNDALIIVITPARGIAGRPSSQRIFKVLMH
jgi:hypothetical protein